MATVKPLGKAAFELLVKDREVIHPLAIGFQQALRQFDSTRLLAEAGQLLLKGLDPLWAVKGSDASEHFVTCPNQDTVYGAGYQHLDTKPVIVQVPDFGGRFFTYQIADARTDSFASIGKQYGTKPGFYLLVGPHWKGAVPKGVNAVYRSPTDLAAIFPRVFQDDTPEDKAAIQPLLRKVIVYPLSEFDDTIRFQSGRDRVDGGERGRFA